MRKKNRSYLKPNPAQTAQMRDILDSPHISEKDLLASKERVIAFMKAHPINHLCVGTRLAIARSLSADTASNRFWREVFCQVFDDQRERGRFRRALLLVSRRFGKERAKVVRKCISNTLAWPKDPMRIAPPPAKLRVFPAWHNIPHVECQNDIYVRLGILPMTNTIT